MSHLKSPLAFARHLRIKQSHKDEKSCSLHSEDGKLNSERPSDRFKVTSHAESTSPPPSSYITFNHLIFLLHI